MQNETVVIVPAYRRPEYTSKCIKSLEDAQDYKDTLFYLVDDGSKDETESILNSCKFQWKHVIINPETCGLRNILINFFQLAKSFKYMVKIDNDCIVQNNWLNDLIHFLDSNKLDILSPNVEPSNAAFVYGKDDKDNLGYRPSKIVGGLWAMKTSLLQDIHFEVINSSNGICGAFSLLNQIIIEKEPRVGWIPSVTIQDIGHWSGKHPDHIKSNSHLEYSIEIGRKVSWD